MIVAKNPLTPESFIQAPRRSPAVPNSTGTLALYSVDTYSLESHSEIKEVKVLDLNTKESALFSDDAKNGGVSWLKGDDVIWTRTGDRGVTEFWIGTAGHGEKNVYLAGSIPAPLFNVTTKDLSNGRIAVVFNGQTTTDEEELFNPETDPKPQTTAREYETINIRFWDFYWDKNKFSVFYTILEKEHTSKKYKLSTSKPINALKGTGLSSPTTPPIPGLASGKQFDVSRNGIVFTAANPMINPAIHHVSKLFYVIVDDWTQQPQVPKLIFTENYDGSSNSAIFSTCGKALAFLQTKNPEDYYINSIFVITLDGSKNHKKPVEVYNSNIAKEHLTLNPDSLSWSNDSKELYVQADEKGYGRLYKAAVEISEDEPLHSRLIPLTSGGSVAAAYPLSDSPSEKCLLVTKSSFIEASRFAILDTEVGKNIETFGMSGGFGLNGSQVSAVYFKGAGDYDVHAWVVKPSYFNKDKKYPLALLIHGGPVSSWGDGWSTRWNPAVFAEQGYIVVMPNPTGSVGFGASFITSIAGEWGGRAYKDIEHCFSYVESAMPFVDISRAVALGGSYGGYMMNWIAGQPLAKKLRTLVCHDGIFSVYSMLATDVSSTLHTDFGGHLWDTKHKWDIHDPAQYTQNWTQPMLIIHSDNDYRCPIVEGLASFNVCQMRGLKSRFLNFPDENHFVLKHENSLRWYRTVLGWINKYADNEGHGRVRLEPPVSQPDRWEEKKIVKSSSWVREGGNNVKVTFRGTSGTRAVQEKEGEER